MANEKQPLQPNRAYGLIMPENGVIERLAFFGEEHINQGQREFYLYGLKINDKTSTFVVYSLIDGNFICDGESISPLQGRKWGKIVGVASISNGNPPITGKTSKLIDKLKGLGVC